MASQRDKALGGPETIYDRIDIDIIRSVYSDNSLDPYAKFRTIVDHIRYSLELGSILVYIRDTDLVAVSHPGRSGYSLWLMSGVSVKAPMHGLIPPRVINWLLAGTELEAVTSDAEHISLGGRVTSQSFWVRESVKGYVKAITSDDSAIFVFNCGDKTDPLVLAPSSRKAFSDIVSLFLSPLLKQAISKQLPADLFAPPVSFKETIERLHHLLLLGRTRQLSDELIPEILLATHSVFASRGQVLGTIFKLQRSCKPPDGGVVNEPETVIERLLFTGVPERLLTPHKPRSIDPTFQSTSQNTPGWNGITAWVAYNGTSLLIEDFDDRTSSDPKFNLKEWYQPAWRDVRSEIAVPIRDPESLRVYGVLNFESRLPRTFIPGDVVWLEWLAQTAGAIMRQASTARILTKLRPSSALISDLRDRNDNIAEDIGIFLDADDVTIQGIVPKTVDYRTEMVSFWSRKSVPPSNRRPPPSVRLDGYTNRIMKTTGPQEPFLFQIGDQPTSDGELIPTLKRYNTDRSSDARTWKDEGEGFVKPVSDVVRSEKFTTQIAVPLFNPKKDPHRKGRRSDERERVRPIGVLWVSWCRWLSDQPQYQPSSSDMDVIIEVAQGLAHILDVHRGLDDPSATGVAHDLLGSVFGTARHYAVDSLKSPLMGDMLGYFTRLPDLYKNRYSSAMSADAIKLQGSVVGSAATQYSVRRLVMSSVAIVTGSYNEFDAEVTQSLVTSATPKFKAFDWMHSLSAVERECMLPDDYWNCMAILYNLVGNAQFGLNCSGPRGISARIGGGQRRGAQIQSTKASQWRIVQRIDETNPQARGSASSQWLLVEVENGYSGPDSTAQLARGIKDHLDTTRRGLGLVKFLATRAYGGWLKFAVGWGNQVGDDSQSQIPSDLEKDGGMDRRVRCELGIPIVRV